MVKKGVIKVIAMLLAAAAFPSFSVVSHAEKAPSISAKSAVLVNADTNITVFSKNGDTVLPMASTTKIMTCIVAIETGELDRRVRIPREAVGIEGTSLYLCEGDVLTMRDLLYGMMLRSANDCALAVALEIGGSIEGFATLMNEKATQLGLINTHFTNPHGLPDEEHYTTAEDLAHLAVFAMENEEFAKIVSTLEYRVEINGGETVKPVKNHNKMLRTYDGAVGVKTGFTKASGRCLVSAAERNGVRMVAVTLDAPSDWSDHTALLDLGFSEFSKVRAVDIGEVTKSIEVFGRGEITVSNDLSFDAVIRNGEKISVKVEGRRPVFAPIDRGEVLATAYVFAGDRPVGSIPLKATVGVAGDTEAGALKRLKQIFR